MDINTPSANTGGVRAVIRAEKLTRVYPLGDEVVFGVREVDLAIPEGALALLKGNSGSGKSTLLSLIAGIDRPTSGQLSVAGQDLKNAGEADLTKFRRQTVGMVFQSFNLLPTLSVLENICLPALLAGKPRREVRDKAADLLQWLDMQKRMAHYPAQLSGGEMQRTAIARALINDPQIILADEPTGNLDSANGRLVVELLVQMNRTRQCAVIIATHSDIADEFATMDICLKDGSISEQTCET